jgi:signal-transduction protein with cAMP-binding, CBS, and nucleotidyltransferase domain
VLLWDTSDYLPEPIVAPVIQRIHQVMEPNGQMLAMFHSASAASVTPLKADFSRYHLTETNRLDLQRAGNYPLLNTFTNRQIEKLFEDFKSFTFFLSKDNVREVLVTR